LVFVHSTSRKWVIAALAVFVLLAFSEIARLYVDWLWFDSLDYSRIFATTLASRWVLGLIVFLLTFAFMMLNLVMTRKYTRTAESTTDDGREIIYDDPPAWQNFLKSKIVLWLFVALSVLTAFAFGSLSSQQWIVVQQFFHSVSFGTMDPVFHKDLSFYIFDLRFYKYVYSLVLTVLIITTVIVAVIYLLTAALDFFSVDWKRFNWPKAHLAILLAVIFLVKSWGYQLQAYGILYSSNGAAFGAGYTDIHARLMAFKVLLVVTLIVAIAILINIFIKRLSWILVSIGLWAVVAILLGGVYPGLVQKLSVVPNEFNREQPYIINNIKYTRAAYGLDKVGSQSFNIAYNLTAGDLQKNSATINNIRLWDWQPLQQTYKAIQEIRTYYTFNDIDIDRYMINGEYRQVMLGARELSQENLPQQAKTWVNQKLKYTHGYGLAMSPVNQVAMEGLPELLVKDIPPRTTTDLKITRPEIYFGEQPNSYVIVNSKTKEFDYPLGDDNAYSIYRDQAGVAMGSLGRRLLLAWVLGDYKLLLSSDVTSQSQLLMYRTIQDRVTKIAPFLQYDGDPYVVVNRGKLSWIQDAYTESDMYPYSQPYENRFNYIRNSVKVVVDAYNGKTTFYLSDARDPIVRSFAGIFPGVFKPISEMPDGLEQHIRYPEDIFSVQATMYSLYHMTDPSVFYNKEDKWNLPQEMFGDKPQQVEPYYLITKLPGQEREEYILMLPFTPNNKENMIGWMYARSDAPNYGQLRVLDFSKQELIYGPMQVESRIDQNSEISQQFSLWNQKGSRVFRGNLLVIPINNSILYVEPVYLQAERSQIPELRRIVTAYGDKVVMGATLEEALNRLFGTAEPETVPTVPAPGDTVKTIAAEASKYFDQAQAALKAGDWAGYGQNMKAVGDALKRLQSKVEGTQ
jgi:uncharacterized membrane protein (UPF0182 family)